MGKAVWEALRIISLVGGLLVLPITAMLGPNRKELWGYGIWEGWWVGKMASATEPSLPIPGAKTPLNPKFQHQLIDQNNQQNVSQNPSCGGTSKSILYPDFSPKADRQRGPIPLLNPTIIPKDLLGLPTETGMAQALHPGTKTTPSGESEAAFREESRAVRSSSENGPRGYKHSLSEPPEGSGSWHSFPEKAAEASGSLLPGGQAPSGELLGPSWKDRSQLGRYLEQLGAAEYAVHWWGGPAGGVYRACCRMNVFPDGSLWTRHVEAWGSTASEAMAKLLEQVVRWRKEREGGYIPPRMGIKTL